MVKIKIILVLTASSLLLVSCTKSRIELNCNLPVINTTTELKSENQNIDLYVDGSGSMLGYVKKDTSNYIQTIEALNNAIDPQEGGSTIEYHRLGQDKPISRSDYRQAQLPEFYDGTNSKFPAVSSQINSAITPTTENQLIVVVTDLEQNDGDIDLLSEAIKQHYYNNNRKYAVGIWAIKSQFEGKVYSPQNDAINFYYSTTNGEIDTYRPFYVLFIGTKEDIKYYFNRLASLAPELTAASKLLLFSPDNIITEVISLPEEQNLPDTPSAITRVGRLYEGSNLIMNSPNNPPKQNYDLLKIIERKIKDNPLTITYSIGFSQPEFSLGIDENSLSTENQVSIVEKTQFTQQPQNSSFSNGIEVNKWEINPENNNLSYSTNINGQNLTNGQIYNFEVNVMIKDLPEPEWWSEWDWNTRENENDGSKTHNILSFLRLLKLQTLELMTKENNPPVVGKLCFAIQKE